jgi:hypothetical protein
LFGKFGFPFELESDEEVDEDEDNDDLAAKSAFIIDNFDCMLSLDVGVPDTDDG